MTMTITIPPEAEIALANEVKRQCGIAISPLAARVAIRAALAAWPGSYSLAQNDSAAIRDVAVIILPLTENTDAET